MYIRSSMIKEIKYFLPWDFAAPSEWVHDERNLALIVIGNCSTLYSGNQIACLPTWLTICEHSL